MTDLHFLEGTLERFEEKFGIIKITDGQELRWPIAQLPEDLQVGGTLRLGLHTSVTDEAEREALAKSILNEMLKKESE